MKSEMKEVKTAGKKFPYLGIDPDRSLIVLFCSGAKGTVVWSKEPTEEREGWKVGTYHENWCVSAFSDFHGEIVLSSS